MTNKVIVFGSINMDLVVKTPRLPIPGETLLGDDFFTAPGGKGANQAVAVAKLGIPTYMVGRVGKDAEGKSLLASLQTYGVSTDYVLTDTEAHSGVAIIAVEDSGQNNIIVVPGANGRVNTEDVERLSNLFNNASALLLQFEIPLSAVILAAKAAQKAGIRVILDPAPAQKDIPEALYKLVDIITPNEIEASQLVGFPVNNPETALEAAAVLRQRGVKTAIVKLGALGVCCATADESFFVPAFRVEAVDTTAAGDAFNGGLVAGLTEGQSLRQAVVWGAAAGAIATTLPGAMPSMPSRDTFDRFVQQHL
ncbi:MAG TPA: ribokinase [Cyanobacteria bacterium UBA11369]|nr:ribokinase [Cyanobacteria bacterium UBA11371]HBE30577.1 ribokinase [Cyanobacteria bacterium UBA11368]HBE51909.1 ribokinase [Cyanobacteria bacterium UBA11369]